MFDRSNSQQASKGIIDGFTSSKKSPNKINNDIFKYGMCQSFSQKCAAFNLAYKEYLKAGYCDKHPSQMRYTLLQFLDTSWTMIGMYGNHLVGTASVVVGSAENLPSSNIVKDIYLKLEDQGRVISEGTLLACIDFEGTKASYVSKNLIRHGICEASERGADDFCVVVNPKHLRFWHEQLGFELLSDSRSCEHVAGHPGLLVRLDLRAIRNGTFNATSDFQKLIMDGWLFQDEIPRGHDFREEEVIMLLLKRPGLLAESPESHIELLRNRFPSAFEIAQKIARDQTECLAF